MFNVVLQLLLFRVGEFNLLKHSHKMPFSLKEGKAVVILWNVEGTFYACHAVLALGPEFIGTIADCPQVVVLIGYPGMLCAGRDRRAV